MAIHKIKISEKSLEKSVTSRLAEEKSRIYVKSDPSDQRRRRRGREEADDDSDDSQNNLDSNEGGESVDKNQNEAVKVKSELMKVDNMASPYVWNELYPNERKSKSNCRAGDSSSIDGMDYKSGMLLLPERPESSPLPPKKKPDKKPTK